MQSEERHLEASAHWGPALQWTNVKNHPIGEAVPGEAVSGVDTGSGSLPDNQQPAHHLSSKPTEDPNSGGPGPITPVFICIWDQSQLRCRRPSLTSSPASPRANRSTWPISRRSNSWLVAMGGNVSPNMLFHELFITSNPKMYLETGI